MINQLLDWLRGSPSDRDVVDPAQPPAYRAIKQDSSDDWEDLGYWDGR